MVQKLSKSYNMWNVITDYMAHGIYKNDVTNRQSIGKMLKNCETRWIFSEVLTIKIN